MFPKLLLILLVAALAVGTVVRSSHGAGPEQLYVVKATDTLWSIAASHYGGDPRAGIWKVQQRNGLHSTVLRPGETLVLP